MSIGKYVTNLGVIGALLGVLGTMKQTQNMPRDWRRFVVWGVWAAGLLLALASVAKQQDDEEFEAAAKEADRAERDAAKALAKARKRA
ncbi:MAG: hypothetical protein AB7V10_03360 [Leucobacter sp.]|jgi:hypothetical protein